MGPSYRISGLRVHPGGWQAGAVCGRYAASRRPEDLVEDFGVQEVDGRTPSGQPLQADWNVAPTKDVPVVRCRVGESGRAVRQLCVRRWGLVPPWSPAVPAVPAVPPLINARAETVDVKPAFRAALRARRCLLPADGWYEWYSGEAAAGGSRQPYFVHRTDGAGLAFAGLYETWRDPRRGPEDPAAWVRTTTVVTTAATGPLRPLHDRMPVVLPAERWARWLDPHEHDVPTLLALLVGLPVGELVADPVSPAVGNVANNGPHLVRRVPALVPPDVRLF